MRKAAVVILNWNGQSFLEQFLPGVTAHTASWADVIVADNASTDNSVEWMTAHYPNIRIIRNAENGGFAKGYNDALIEIDAEYFILLNSDVEVTPNWLEPMIELMDADHTIAACQPKIRAFHDREHFEYAGAAGGYIDKWGYPFCRGRIFDSFEEDHGQYDDNREVFWATGACLVVRSSCWHETGGLDQDFFAHMEEIDLCWRMKNRGWKVMYCGSSTVFHVGGGTLSKLSPKKTYLNFRNNIVLLAKNHAPGFFWLKIFLRFCLDGIAGMKFFFSGQFSHCWAVVRAHASFYRTLPRTLRKRRAMKQQIRHYSETAIYRGSIVFAYYLRGKKKFSDLDPEKFGS